MCIRSDPSDTWHSRASADTELAHTDIPRRWDSSRPLSPSSPFLHIPFPPSPLPRPHTAPPPPPIPPTKRADRIRPAQAARARRSGGTAAAAEASGPRLGAGSASRAERRRHTRTRRHGYWRGPPWGALVGVTRSHRSHEGRESFELSLTSWKHMWCRRGGGPDRSALWP